MLRIPLRLLPFLIGLSSADPGFLGAQEFQVDFERTNQVSFLSDAPLEDFRGVTSRVDGYVFLPGGESVTEDVLGKSEFHFEVDLASLDTGMGLRNRHMRENYLETDRFPFAAFTGRIVTILPRGGRGGYSVAARGDFEVHGVAREREIDCTAVPLLLRETLAEELRTQGPLSESPELRIRCAFQVALSDHGIPIPKLMFMKIEEIMEVEVDFHLKLITKEGLLPPSPEQREVNPW